MLEINPSYEQHSYEHMNSSTYYIIKIYSVTKHTYTMGDVHKDGFTNFEDSVLIDARNSCTNFEWFVEKYLINVFDQIDVFLTNWIRINSW